MKVREKQAFLTWKYPFRFHFPGMIDRRSSERSVNRFGRRNCGRAYLNDNEIFSRYPTREIRLRRLGLSGPVAFRPFRREKRGLFLHVPPGQHRDLLVKGQRRPADLSDALIPGADVVEVVELPLGLPVGPEVLRAVVEQRALPSEMAVALRRPL